MLELQQQLCDAESATEQLRKANSELTSKVDVLQANNVNATMWRQSQVHYKSRVSYLLPMGIGHAQGFISVSLAP